MTEYYRREGLFSANERRQRVKPLICTFFRISLEENKMFRNGEMTEVPGLII